MAFAFRQLRHGSDSSRVGSDLVPISASVCRVVATAFAVMLAVVLAGIGMGGIAAGAISRRSTGPNQLVSVLLLLAAIAVLLSYLLFPGEAVKTAAGAFSLASWWQIAIAVSGVDVPGIVFIRAGVSDHCRSRFKLR